MNRIADSIRTCNRLKLFWAKAQNSIPWKIQVFHSILQSKLLYRLETIQLNQSELHRLDAFQIKGYRRILHIPPTSVDRTMTNASVKELIKRHYGVTAIEFSKLWLKRKKTSLRTHHSIRPTRSHGSGPFLPNSLIPRTEHARRVGKPRAHWLVETYADAYRESGHVDQFHQQHSSKKFSKRIGPAKTQHFSLKLHRAPLHRKFHHRKLRHRKFRHRKRANSRPTLRNNRCLPPLCSFLLLFFPPCLII